MEPRIAHLESDVAYIKRDISEIKTDLKDFRAEYRFDMQEFRKSHQRDFRLTFGALIAAVLGMTGVMAKGFHWL